MERLEDVREVNSVFNDAASSETNVRVNDYMDDSTREELLHQQLVGEQREILPSNAAAAGSPERL